MSVSVMCPRCQSADQTFDPRPDVLNICSECGEPLPNPESAPITTAERPAPAASAPPPPAASAQPSTKRSAPKPVKLCAACGASLAGVKRLKDNQGNYFCVPCSKNGAAAKFSLMHQLRALPGTSQPCAFCGSKVSPDKIKFIDDTVSCADCYPLHVNPDTASFGRCVKCQKRHLPEELMTLEEGPVCDDCYQTALKEKSDARKREIEERLETERRRGEDPGKKGFLSNWLSGKKKEPTTQR